MSRSVTHTTFAIERTFSAPPERVFAAFADPATKERWFVMPAHWEGKEHALDFRVGGREINRGGPPAGTVHTFDARYHGSLRTSGSSTPTTCTSTTS